MVETNHHAAFLFCPKFNTASYVTHSKALRLSMSAFNVKNVPLSLKAIIEKSEITKKEGFFREISPHAWDATALWLVK